MKAAVVLVASAPLVAAQNVKALLKINQNAHGMNVITQVLSVRRCCCTYSPRVSKPVEIGAGAPNQLTQIFRFHVSCHDTSYPHKNYRMETYSCKASGG
jgi:hypothetical protein